MKVHKLFLIFAIGVACFLRFYQLGQNPPSLTWDEASWGYNAYSLGLDGRDEFGNFLPIQYLTSFGDFKPPVYAYLDIIPIKVFGLTEFAVRFPSALFGSLTVLVTYFLVKKIFSKNSWVALLTAFFLAISPWHINLSRAAFEANVGTFFIVTGVWLFIEVIQGKKWFLPISIASFVLSMYTFNTARIVSPIFVVGLSVTFWRNMLLAKKQLALAVLVGAVLFAPLLQFSFTPQARLRFQEVNIFSNPDVVTMANQEVVNDNDALWSKILHNRRFVFTVEYARHYFDHFNPQFLFIKGDGNPKFSTQDVGELYLWDLPLFIAGILLLLKKKEGYWKFIFFWLLIGIIPAATARETPHALRIEATIPTFQIIIAYGVVFFFEQTHTMKNKKARYVILSFASTFLFINFLYYVHGYYMHYPREFSGEWQFGYKESITYAKGIEDQYENIIATDALGRPYIYYLFYTKTDPAFFRKTAHIYRDPFAFTHVDSFGKYQFIDDPNKKIDHLKKILYINLAGREAEKAEVVKKFYLLNGQPILSAYRF
jgi:4-amino-4-deoxy-L-arabinose transferase-like glycosyltransferase